MPAALSKGTTPQEVEAMEPKKKKGSKGLHVLMAALALGAPFLLSKTLSDLGMKQLMYFTGPFFCWPHKPLFNLFRGAPYQRAYAHFRRDHSVPLNVYGHFLCLFYQVGSNFSLLHCMDRSGILAKWTAGVWSLLLLCQQGSPLVVRIASALSILLGYKCRGLLVGDEEAKKSKDAEVEGGLLEAGGGDSSSQLAAVPKKKFTPTWVKIACTWQGILEVLEFHCVIMDSRNLLDPKLALYLAARLGFGQILQKFHGALAFKGVRPLVQFLYLLFFAKLCRQNPADAALQGYGTGGAPGDVTGQVTGAFSSIWGPTPQMAYGNKIAWIGRFATPTLAVLLDSPGLFFWSGSHNLLQGLPHNFGEQMGTLGQLNSVPDEMSHVTYFPNLVMQSTWQTLKLQLKAPPALATVS